MNFLSKIAFALEDFAVPSAGQQLLDRFLIGYNLDGDFRSTGAQVVLAGPDNAAVQSRVKDFGLKLDSDLGKAVVVVPKGDGAAPSPELTRRALSVLPRGARCFVYGLLANDRQTAEQLRDLARARGVWLATGSATATAFRLPRFEFHAAGIRKALAVTFGASAEFDALEMLRTALGARMEQQSAEVRLWQGGEAWKLACAIEWRELLAAAVSRSNTIQGDPEKDGRTQDIVGLQLLEKLAAKPRAWTIGFAGGLGAAVFDLTGALEDLNFAAATEAGVVSTQFYRPPLPMQDHFSPLAEQIERFFRADQSATSVGLVALPALLEKMRL